MSATTHATAPSTTASSTRAAAQAPTDDGKYYQPFYSDPVNRPTAPILWAARDASTEWGRIFAAQDWDAIDEATVSLAVFDKAYEWNQAQWGCRGWQTPAEWRKETDSYASIAFVRILTFCRAALDLCAEPLVDDGPVRVALLDEIPPPPAIPGDRIGRLLAQFDPVVRHAEQLAEPLEGVSAVFVYAPRRGAYVLEEEADVDPGVSDLTSYAHVPGSHDGDADGSP
ncbi:uncharacterized protein EHS24_008752 [Apiotrichum porosum]|uniref:Uncharacterized protein n=1 Tax=Apiotrichum porosum TaxID=105984 RepID=A0A427XR23_9TREE|nr:uncharacterized protein EHS24_008752 [Apiotrichum porosum]RSH81309.1 hypothetical protein EHS24_008752 [Apiotrichum porosum]